MTRYPTLFVTERGQRHQAAALRAAPSELEMVMLRSPDRESLMLHLQAVIFLISERSGAIDREMIAAAPKLQLIVRLGSLSHDIDLDAARSAGVVVCVQPLQGAIMHAEHCVMQILALAKRLRAVEQAALTESKGVESRRTDEDTFAYNWTHQRDINGILGSTVGIMGFGESGVELARRLRNWSCRVGYHRRRQLPPVVEADLGIQYLTRERLLADSDFVVNLLPYSLETDLSFGKSEFERMKPGSYLVSCGSGSVVDESALAESLRSGHLAGAALDTFEWEPLLPDNPLRVLASGDPGANVLLTPHTAGGAPSGSTGTRNDDYRPIVQFLRGEPLVGRIA
jgi:phosphoglycerate dehydrogenase-like enzyme